MANSDYTNDQLLLAIKRRTFMPAPQIAFTDTELLAMADEEQRTFIVPFLRGINEEHLLYKQTYTLDGSTTSWLLPGWATGEALRSVEITNSNGDFIPWQRVEPGQEQKTRTGFYIDDERIVAASVPPPSGTMRVRYWRRPGKLVLVARARDISGTLQGGATATYADSGAPPWSHFSSVQIVEAGPGVGAGGVGFRTAWDGLANVVTNTSTTLTPTPDATISTNIYLCLADESPVPQVPLECHALLAQKVACSVIEHRGAPNLQSAREELAQLKESVTELLSDRTQQEPRHVQNFYGPGWKRFRARRLLP